MPIVLAADDTLWDMINKTMTESGGVEKAVFYLLIGFSLISWSIIFWKVFSFFEATRNTKKFMVVFDSADSFGEAMAHGSATGASPVMTVFKATMIALENRHTGGSAPTEARGIKINPGSTREEVIELSMRHTASEYFSKLQFGLGFLATAGSATPFIGLFGTVWGILTTFRHIGSSGKNDLAGVGSGISSALIATAAGLAVAIPAVIAYNSFLASMDGLQDKTDRFIERVMMLVRGSGTIATEIQTHASVPLPSTPAVAAQVVSHPAPVAQVRQPQPSAAPPAPAAKAG